MDGVQRTEPDAECPHVVCAGGDCRLDRGRGGEANRPVQAVPVQRDAKDAASVDVKTQVSAAESVTMTGLATAEPQPSPAGGETGCQAVPTQ
jgi:hypothetical protein